MYISEFIKRTIRYDVPKDELLLDEHWPNLLQFLRDNWKTSLEYPPAELLIGSQAERATTTNKPPLNPINYIEINTENGQLPAIMSISLYSYYGTYRTYKDVTVRVAIIDLQGTIKLLDILYEQEVNY